MHAEKAEMVPESMTSLPIRLRNALCCLFLMLAVLCEAYTVAAIALDQFAQSWYRTLGWLLFALPTALVVGLLLLYANCRRFGFYLIATSLALYALLVCLDAYQGPAARGDWIFVGAWLAFCALGIVAARSLMSRPMPVDSVSTKQLGL